LEVLLVLGVDRFELAIKCGFEEKRADEELSETVEGSVERWRQIKRG
jgi:Zn ribbon nucleic-acid-binding protein